jgi:hypothetical protein
MEDNALRALNFAAPRASKDPSLAQFVIQRSIAFSIHQQSLPLIVAKKAEWPVSDSSRNSLMLGMHPAGLVPATL